MSNYLFLFLLIGILFSALYKRINAYSIFVEGAEECLKLFMNIYPSLLAIILLVRMVEASEILELIDGLFGGIPKEVIMMAFFRPFSGNASLAILMQIFDAYGADSLPGMLGSVLQGATDTTFYVIALYFGSVNVKRIGNTLTLSLLADGLAMGLGIYFVLKFF